MKLLKLIVDNFRGINGPNNVIDFSNSNILFLIGQNNAGKSSLLHAYEFFVGSSSKAAVTDFFDQKPANEIQIEAFFEVEETDRSNSDLVGSGKTAEPDWIGKWVDAGNVVRVRKTWSSVGTPFAKETWSPLEQKFVPNGFGGFHSILQKYAPTPILIGAIETEESLETKVNKLIQDEFIKDLTSQYPEQLAEIKALMFDLQEKIGGSAAIEVYNESINEHFQKVFGSLKLKIEAKDGEQFKIEDAFAKKGHSLSVWREGVARKEVFSQHGHGVIRQALFNFLSFIGRSRAGTRKEYLILFEEPELYLHPEITFLMRNNLYALAENSPFQVVCATHSPMMIDLSKPHSSLVRVVKKANEETSIYQVGDDVFRSTSEKKSRIQMINRFNPHVCEAFFGNKVILVEGDTEAIVFRDLIGRFYPKHEIYVLNTGSKLNIAFFQEILTAFHIEHYVIHDADNRKDKNGDVNNVWTANETIWNGIETANSRSLGLGTRYVMIRNFEIAHGRRAKSLKGKPLAAYEFVKTLTGAEDLPCINYLSYIVNGPPEKDGKPIVHDQDYLAAQVPDIQA